MAYLRRVFTLRRYSAGTRLIGADGVVVGEFHVPADWVDGGASHQAEVRLFRNPGNGYPGGDDCFGESGGAEEPDRHPGVFVDRVVQPAGGDRLITDDRTVRGGRRPGPGGLCTAHRRNGTHRRSLQRRSPGPSQQCSFSRFRSRRVGCCSHDARGLRCLLHTIPRARPRLAEPRGPWPGSAYGTGAEIADHTGAPSRGQPPPGCPVARGASVGPDGGPQPGPLGYRLVIAVIAVIAAPMADHSTSGSDATPDRSAALVAVTTGMS